MLNVSSETLLPNGIKIFSRVEDKISILYEQVQEYFRNGIEVREGDTIFDVGANIGLFTLLAYHKCYKNANVYAFEPIPATFEVLHRNAQCFDSQKLKVFPCGLSQESKMVTFAYYPRATELCNAYPGDVDEQRNQIKKSILLNFKDAPPSIRRLRWVPPFLRSLVVDWELKKMFKSEPIVCQMRTISEIVHEYNIERIDLLKVDAEKGELDVLAGIEETDWLKIKQIVIEAHDLDNRVEKITNLLKKHEFSQIIVEQEPMLKGTNIFNIFGLRSKSE